MFVFKICLIGTVLAATSAQNFQGPTTTPVPILKQINRQNDDGSYSFGYEAADGSFKIETKHPNGDVAGKYGYVDESGQLREITYGATKDRGFEPQGYGIKVPPPTLHDPTSHNALTDGQEDDGQYREDPKIYEDPKYNSRAQKSRPAQTFNQYQVEAKPQKQIQQVQQPSFQTQFSSKPAFRQEPIYNQAPQQFNQDFAPQSQTYHQQPQFSFQSFTGQGYQPQPQTYQQSYQPQTYQPQTYQNQAYQPQVNPYQNFNPFFGHPAQNFDPNTGSYSINFTGK